MSQGFLSCRHMFWTHRVFTARQVVKRDAAVTAGEFYNLSQQKQLDGECRTVEANLQEKLNVHLHFIKLNCY